MIANRSHYCALLIGVMAGLISGLVVTLFRWLVKWLFTSVSWIYCMSIKHWTLILLMLIVNTVIGFLISQLIKSDPGIKGSGIPQVEGQLKDNLHYAWFPILWRKVIASTLTVGSGAFMGHEGPAIQLGAAASQSIAKLTSSSRQMTHLIIGSGAAAGLTAIFNAPIASSLFVLEGIYHNFSPVSWIVTLTAAVMSDLISMAIFGSRPFLYLPGIKSLPLRYLVLLIGLGVLVGLLGFVYKKVTLSSFRWYSCLRINKKYRNLLPLLLVIPVGIMWPKLIGSGSYLIHLITKPGFPVVLIIGYFIARLILCSLAFGSGLPGGIFLPILTLGALVGNGYAQFLVNVGLLPRFYVATLVIISMAGYFACIAKTPFTSIILITEMVGTLHHLLALAIVTLVACAVDDLLGGKPIYSVLLGRLLQPGDEQSASGK